jgi:hypothetical protein
MQNEEWDFFRKDKLRQRLFEALSVGRLSLDEANALAAEAGTNLNPSDNPDNYDPSELPHWSMPMALSWVTFRSQFAVRSAWGHFKSSQYDWKPIGPSLPTLPAPLPMSTGDKDPRSPTPLPAMRGWQLRQQSVPTVNEMIRLGSPWGDEFADGPFKHSKGIHRSYRDLIEALAKNKVTSMGVDLRRGRDASPAPVTPEEWSLLQIMEFEAGDAWGFRPNAPIFINVLVDRQSLMDEFEGWTADEPAVVPDQDTLTGERGRDDAPQARAVRGAPVKYAWGQFRDECQRLWDENGGFSDDDPVFSRQGHLVDLMETWCIDQTARRRDGWPRVPSRSQLKEHVKAFLTSVADGSANKS